jgi:hypothetical protein
MGALVSEQLLRGVNILGVEVGAGEFLHGPFHNLHLLGRHSTFALQRGQARQYWF